MRGVTGGVFILSWDGKCQNDILARELDPIDLKPLSEGDSLLNAVSISFHE
jgi:hypothetical protein